MFSSHRNLNVGNKSSDFTEIKKSYAYLTDLRDIKVSMADVKVIVGQDAYHLIRHFDYKSGDRYMRWTVKTSLGSTVNGGLRKTKRYCMAASCNLSISSDPLADQMKR